MRDLCCSKHMSNNRNHFSDFVKCNAAGQIDSKEVITSYGFRMVRMITTMDGVTHNVALQEVMHTAEIVQILISISQVRRTGFRVLIEIRS